MRSWSSTVNAWKENSNPGMDVLASGLFIESVISILKCRGELLYLNYIPWIANRIYLCTQCNEMTREDTEHFLAKCPILAVYRRRHLGARTLSRDQTMINVLNGSMWPELCSFVKQAWSYRRLLINKLLTTIIRNKKSEKCVKERIKANCCY